MRRAIRESGRGTQKLSAEGEAEVERDAALAMELSVLLLPFLERHEEADPEVVGAALIQRAAVHLMVSYDMSPEDFGAFAQAVAEEFQEEARELRRKAMSVGQG